MRLKISEDALKETQDSSIYYNNCEKGLGYDFLNEVNLGLRLIEENPYLYSCIKKDFRRILINKFPFGIIYKINKNVIYIVAIMHLRKKPYYWQSTK